MRINGIKLIIVSFSVLLSFFLVFFTSETILRSQQYGFISALRSYFVNKPPYSVLGVSNWVINDDVLGYRYNPKHSGINSLSIPEKEIITPKPAGVKRIIILGDSIPITGNPTFVDLLKQTYQETNNQVEIINASTPGYTNYQELYFLKKYLLQIQPDIVLLSYVLNDNHQFLHLFDEKEEMLLTEEAKNSLEIHNVFDKLVSQSFLLSRFKLGLLEKQKQQIHTQSIFWWDGSAEFNTAWKHESWIDVDTQIQTMNTVLKEQNAKLLIVIFPIESQLDKNLLSINREYVLQPQDEMKRLSQTHMIPYLDLFPIFYKETTKHTSRLFIDGLHLSTAGHQISNTAIYEFFNQNL